MRSRIPQVKCYWGNKHRMRNEPGATSCCNQRRVPLPSKCICKLVEQRSHKGAYSKQAPAVRSVWSETGKWKLYCLDLKFWAPNIGIMAENKLTLNTLFLSIGSIYVCSWSPHHNKKAGETTAGKKDYISLNPTCLGPDNSPRNWMQLTLNSYGTKNNQKGNYTSFTQFLPTSSPKDVELNKWMWAPAQNVSE